MNRNLRLVYLTLGGVVQSYTHSGEQKQREIFVQNFCRQIFLRRTNWEIWKASYGSDFFFFWFLLRDLKAFRLGATGERDDETMPPQIQIVFFGLCLHSPKNTTSAQNIQQYRQPYNSAAAERWWWSRYSSTTTSMHCPCSKSLGDRRSEMPNNWQSFKTQRYTISAWS